MLNVYRKFVKYTLDGERVWQGYNIDSSTIVLLEADEAINTDEKWCGIDNIKKALETELSLPYGYTTFHKYLYMRNADICKVRVWQNSILEKRVIYRIEDVSLYDIMKLSCGEKVIQYFKERGLTICPMKA